jgi:hypothetical protein
MLVPHAKLREVDKQSIALVFRLLFAVALKTLFETMGWRVECHRERHAGVVIKGLGAFRERGGVWGGWEPTTR